MTPFRKRLTCGLIVVPVVVFMLLKILTFGNSGLLQKRSSCQCSLSCEGAPEHLKKLKRVHVYVEHQSDPVHEEIYNISSVFREDGRCSVAVPICLQQDTQFILRIYADENNPVHNQLYEKKKLKPECTEKNLRSGADRIVFNTLLTLLVFCCFVVF